LKDEPLFAFAGIWNVLKDSDKPILSCAIITTKANALMDPIHERMPVIIEKESEKNWLAATDSTAIKEKFLIPYCAQRMAAYEISKNVNNPTCDDPGIAMPLAKKANG
jgi:putative SOS response-associated peptidase YedK